MTREHIVRAADELFYQQGFDHTSFADIAKAVNISRGNFYGYTDLMVDGAPSPHQSDTTLRWLIDRPRS